MSLILSGCLLSWPSTAGLLSPFPSPALLGLDLAAAAPPGSRADLVPPVIRVPWAPTMTSGGGLRVLFLLFSSSQTAGGCFSLLPCGASTLSAPLCWLLF